MSSYISYISSLNYSDLHAGSLFSIHVKNKNLQDKMPCSSYVGLTVDFIFFAVACEFCDGWS